MKKIKLIIILCCLLSLNINNKNNNNITKVEASELVTSNQIVENNNNFNISFNDIEYPLYVEELDYVELMTLDDINTFNNWILSFNVNHNSKENILFVRNNLNKLILKAIKLNVIRDILNQNNTRFSGDTHSLILTHAIEIFEYDCKFEVTNFYVNYLDTLSDAVQAPDDGYQYMWIYNGSGSSANILWTQEIEHKVGEQDSNYRTYIFNDAIIDLEDIISNQIYMRYGASGSGNDTLKNKNLKLDFIVY